VDEFHLYVASAVVGRQGSRGSGDRRRAVSSLTARAVGRDVFLEGYVHRPH
jgi:hypothetical protein